MVFLHFRKFPFFAVVFLSFFLLGVNSLYSGVSEHADFKT